MKSSPYADELDLIDPDLGKSTFTAAQCRAARALLNWSQAKLSVLSNVGITTLGDFERETRMPCDHLLRDIRSVLEGAGIEFIAEGSGGLGLRLATVNRYAEAPTADVQPSIARRDDSTPAQPVL
jgi:transcriptional regulator with XRE-family HTH domain